VVVQSEIAWSTSASWATRSVLVAKRGSSAMSGRPAARMSRLKIESPLPPMMTCSPSWQR
jgi:hypothetical protein